jgi:prepilin-type N-terminal cleavage/methylation domain-containing protein
MLLHISMRAKPSLHHRRGFTLTEIAIVLGVMGMILGAIWGAASTVYANKKTTAALQEILAIVANVRGLYPNGQIPAATVLSPILINAGQVPSNMIGSCAGTPWGAGWGGTAGCMFSPWNTQIVIGTQYGWLPGDTPNTFDFIIFNLSNPQCASFAMQLIQQAAPNGLTYFYSDSTGVIGITSATSPTAVQSCQGNVYLQFTL